MISEKKAAIFLVGGIPASQKDLEGWKAFKSFCGQLKGSNPVTVYVETFEYGEGEVFDATPEEVAYIYMRMEIHPDFIENRTKKTGESEFFL